MKIITGPNKDAVETDPFPGLAAELRELAVQAGREVAREIDSIIESGDRDTGRIEHLLDHMLGFCFHDDMLCEFKRLCRYLYAIDPQAAADYVQAYWEMWEQNGKAEDSVLRKRQSQIQERQSPDSRLGHKKAERKVGALRERNQT
jgi:hypothetical protein